MPVARRLVRSGAVSGALALGLALGACSGPAGPAGPVTTDSACPSGFLEAANEAALRQDLGVTFSVAVAADFEPQAALTAITAGCFLAFDGAIGADRAAGAFAFATETVDAALLEAALLALGYQPSEQNAWVKADPSDTSRADVVTLATPSGDGVLLDLSTIFPEVRNVVSSFRISAG